MNSIMALTIGLLSATTWASNPTFERLKGLEGDWIVSDAGEESVIRYDVIAGGNALSEQHLGMLTVYHPDEGEMLATHYCASGSVSRFRAEAGSTDFRLLDVANESQAPGYVASIVFEWLPDGRVVQRGIWRARDGSEFPYEIVMRRQR